MKRKKTLLILGIVLLVSIGAIIGITAVEKHVDKVNTIDEEVFTIDPENVSEVSIDYESKQLSFVKSDSNWIDSSDSDFPIDQDYMTQLLNNFESVHASFIIDDVTDYSQYGLKVPTATISFKENDDTKTITFGTYSTIDSKRYICVDGGSVYLIDTDILADISSSRDDYMANKEVPDFTQITEVKASGAATFTAKYEPDADYTYTDKYDYYVVDGDEHKAVDTENVESYVKKITSMDTTDYETYEADEEAVEKYGLDKPTLTITITGEVAKEDDSNETESKEVTVYFSSVDDEKCYARVGESPIIYNVDPDVYASLADGSYASLRPSEVIAADFTEVSSVYCNADDQEYTVSVSKDSSADEGVAYTVEDKEIEFQYAADKIKALTLSEAGSNYKKGKQELEFTVTLNDDANTSLHVILYRYDGEACALTLNGETIGLVSRDAMSGLREAMISANLKVE